MVQGSARIWSIPVVWPSSVMRTSRREIREAGRAAVGVDQPIFGEQGEDLAQVGLGNALMLRDLVAGDGPLVTVHGDVEHRADAVFTFGGDLHLWCSSEV
jgi:hypothetical protein